ncbi:MAG: energy-coupling factor transporter transmembrane protein EcfT [Treponema sp.]|nr:energy-coupling factor transporter transmembrane protein EcfT [Treponema sp.]
MVNAVFKYKTNKTALHKAPAILKLLLLLPLSVLCMLLPSLYLSFGIIALVIIAFIFRFTLLEQVTDLKPAFFYAVLMYSLSVFSNLFELLGGHGILTLKLLTPNTEYLRLSLRLFMIVQISALFFRTTSSLEIRDSLNKIMPKLSESISLFICFIPQIFLIWSNINLSWKARCGKQGLKKTKLLFVLISLCFEKAALKAKVIQGRKI